MKQFFYASFVLILLVLGSELKAQPYDYLDIPQGYETLNLAISGDTTATGQPVSVNRVYRLERDGYYLTNGTISNVKNNVLRIHAANGPGKIPIILTTGDNSGANRRAFALTADGEFKNIYISGRSNLGIYTDDAKDMIRLQEIGIKVELDSCFLEHEWKDFVRMNASNQTVIIKNSILRNAGDLADASDNQFIDTRSQVQNLIKIQNSTLYVATGRAFRTGGGAFFKDFILDHCTFYQLGNGDGMRGDVDSAETPLFSVERGQNVTVTNNIFMDVVFHGDEINSYTSNDTLGYPLFGFLSLNNPSIPDDTRNIVLRNNSLGTTQALLDYYATQNDTVKPPVFLNDYSINTYFNNYPLTWKQENNFNESIQFTDAPSPDPVVAYTAFRRACGFCEIGVPEFWADRNGIGDNPDTWGPATDEYEFSYNTSATAYTAGDKGFPLGDLNWYPVLKKLWEDGGAVGVEDNVNNIPTEFALEQNYPNPFNPSTQIAYTLPKLANVSLTIHNILGQKVATLVSNQIQNADKYTVTWNGKDSNGNTIASGIYIYQLKADNILISKKMLLMK